MAPEVPKSAENQNTRGDQTTETPNQLMPVADADWSAQRQSSASARAQDTTGLPKVDLIDDGKNKSLDVPREGIAARSAETSIRNEKDPRSMDRVENFAMTINSLFPMIDKNQDDFIDANESGTFVETYNGPGANAVAALHAGRSGLQYFSRDEKSLSENDGTTRNDLKGFEETRQRLTSAMSQELGFHNWSKRNFDKADKDGNDFLNRAELRAARLKASAEDRYYIDKMLAGYDEWQLRSDDEFFSWSDSNGLSQNDLSVRYEEARDEYGRKIGRIENVLSNAERNQADHLTGGRLFANEKNPLESITPDAIHQGRARNAAFLAALTSLAATNPQAIKNMIRENKDGSLTVTFPGDPKHPITFERPTPGELALYNGDRKGHGRAIASLEKAYGIHSELHGSDDGPTAIESSNPSPTAAADALLGTRTETTSLTVLTGLPAVAVKIHNAMKTGGIVTAQMASEEMMYQNIVPDQPYAVIDFDPLGRDGGTVTVRNPRGGADNSPHGTLKMSLSDFRRDFTKVHVTMPKKLK